MRNVVLLGLSTTDGGRNAHPGCFGKLPPGPLHVGLCSEHALGGPDHQLRVALWGEGLRQAVAGGRRERETNAGNHTDGILRHWFLVSNCGLQTTH